MIQIFFLWSSDFSPTYNFYPTNQGCQNQEPRQLKRIIRHEYTCNQTTLGRQHLHSFTSEKVKRLLLMSYFFVFLRLRDELCSVLIAANTEFGFIINLNHSYGLHGE